MVEMLEKTAGYICSDELGFECEELLAMVKESYAHYYIKRSKPSASYQYLIVGSLKILSINGNLKRKLTVSSCLGFWSKHLRNA